MIERSDWHPLRAAVRSSVAGIIGREAAGRLDTNGAASGMRILAPLWVGVCMYLCVGGCEKSPPDTSVTPRAGPEATTRSASPDRPDGPPQVSAVRNNWSGFRGNNGRGSADGQNLPDSWGVEPRKNIRWRTRIRGLGHSSPIVWGGKVFIATAVKTDADPRRDASDDPQAGGQYYERSISSPQAKRTVAPASRRWEHRF